ncbi:MAG: peptidylprolyl isomerase [Bacteroidales bacterium]|nr:peptidylprolyl isomerase [Bacteroidales bacterium]
MAAIGKIREKSGLLLVIIGLALAAFVLGDLFKNLGQNNNIDRDKIALINGEKVGVQDFSRKVSLQADRYNEPLSTEKSYENTIDVWNITKREVIMRQQMTKIGLLVPVGSSNAQISMDEFMSNIYSVTPNREVIRFFTGDYNGQIAQDQVKGFFDFIERGVNSENAEERSQAMEYKQQWGLFKNSFKDVLMETKYNNLIVKAYYLPKALAEMDFIDNNVSNQVAYFGASYNIISDEDAVATDADYQAYYDEHKNEFNAEMESRKIDYVSWIVRPSNKDVVDLRSQIDEYYNEMKVAERREVSYIVNRVGDNRYDSSWVSKGSLSVYIDSAAFTYEVGTVLGPWEENSAYHIARIMSKDSRPDSLKASQILISYAGAYGAQGITRTKIGARALADSIRDVVANDDSSFETLLLKSDDPKAVETKGEFGWFKDGAMLAEINDACIDGSIGDIVVVETTIGYSVIRIDDKLEKTPKIKIALIDLPIVFSQETFNESYSKAIKFAAVNRTYEAFDTASANSGLNVIKGEFVSELSGGVTGLRNSRDVVKWMFDAETNVGDISKVFDFEDRVVVAVLTETRPEGILPLEDVKEYIAPLVIAKVKASILKEKMANVNSLEQASEFNAQVDTSLIAFSTYSLQKYGPEPRIISRMASADADKIEGPIAGDQGLYYFKVLDKGQIPASNDLQYMQQRSASVFAQKVYPNQRNPKATNAYTPLEKNADIESNMFFFY